MQWILADHIDCCEWTDASIPENPSADLDAIEEEFPQGSERWEAYSALSSEYNPVWTGPPMNLPWYVESPENFETWADGRTIPSELILTDEQIELLDEPLPMFLNGPAGSGKTTLALYRLLVLQEQNPDAKIGFITHSPRLVSHAEEMYNALPTRPEEAESVDFLTYHQLLARVLDVRPFVLQQEMAGPDLLRDLLNHRDLKNADRRLFETEIRSLIKGRLPLRERPPRCRDICRLLPEDAYRQLPEKWSAVPVGQRSEAYRLATQYQQELEESGQRDVQDTTTEALSQLLSGSVRRMYSAVVLDEVQDMTEKQLRVTMATLKRSGWDQMLLAGDPTQVLNGSGFEWRMPRSLFYERTDDVPSPRTLVRSFRAGASTLVLAERLANRLREEGGSVVALDPEKARETGHRPVRVAPGESIDQILSQGHPDVLILTSGASTASELRKRWGHPFVWTVNDAKGLEADHVVLYRLPDRLRRIPGAEPAQREASRRANRRRLRLHYVGATRARKSVTAVVSPHPAESLWKDSSIEAVVNQRQLFQPPWRESPPEKVWLSRARYYRDQEQWTAASECFRSAGSETWARIVGCLGGGDNLEEELFALCTSSTDLSKDQYQFLLDHAGRIEDYDLRIWLLRGVGRRAEADALQAQRDAARGDWCSAAEYYKSEGEYKRAAQHFLKAELWEQAASCFSEYGDQHWAKVCTALSEHSTADGVVRAVRQIDRFLKRSCAQFLVDLLGELNDVEDYIWLLERAKRLDDARELRQKQQEKQDRAHPRSYRVVMPKRGKAYEQAREKAAALRKFKDDPVIVSAARAGMVNLVRQLVEGGEDISDRGVSNVTALHAAAWARHYQVVEYLLNVGASPNLLDDDNETPLYSAVSQVGGGSEVNSRPLLPIVRLLVEAGARPDAHSNTYITPRNFTENEKVSEYLKRAEILYYRCNPDVEPIENEWNGSTISKDEGLDQAVDILGEAARHTQKHLPCKEARRLWNKYP
jgi:uncharacterized membrane protein